MTLIGQVETVTLSYELHFGESKTSFYPSNNEKFAKMNKYHFMSINALFSKLF
jgi:hypothetical protein